AAPADRRFVRRGQCSSAYRIRCRLPSGPLIDLGHDLWVFGGSSYVRAMSSWRLFGLWRQKLDPYLPLQQDRLTSAAMITLLFRPTGRLQTETAVVQHQLGHRGHRGVTQGLGPVTG